MSNGEETEVPEAPSAGLTEPVPEAAAAAEAIVPAPPAAAEAIVPAPPAAGLTEPVPDAASAAAPVVQTMVLTTQTTQTLALTNQSSNSDIVSFLSFGASNDASGISEMTQEQRAGIVQYGSEEGQAIVQNFGKAHADLDSTVQFLQDKILPPKPDEKYPSVKEFKNENLLVHTVLEHAARSVQSGYVYYKLKKFLEERGEQVNAIEIRQCATQVVMLGQKSNRRMTDLAETTARPWLAEWAGSVTNRQDSATVKSEKKARQQELKLIFKNESKIKNDFLTRILEDHVESKKKAGAPPAAKVTVDGEGVANVTVNEWEAFFKNHCTKPDGQNHEISGLSKIVISDAANQKRKKYVFVAQDLEARNAKKSKPPSKKKQDAPEGGPGGSSNSRLPPTPPRANTPPALQFIAPMAPRLPPTPPRANTPPALQFIAPMAPGLKTPTPLTGSGPVERNGLEANLNDFINELTGSTSVPLDTA